MNAYELADYVDAREINNPHLKESATMLRQQADQLDKVIPQLVKANGIIENLRIRIKELEDVLSTYELRDLNNTSRIAELEKELAIVKQMHDAISLSSNKPIFSKPVAWMHKNPDYAISKHQSLEYNIPLYTHPVKQLSDEEIEAIMYKCDWSYDPVSFARAIIKEITE